MKASILAAALTLAAATSAFAQSSDNTPGYGPDSNPVLQSPGSTAEVETPINNLRARLIGASPSVCIESSQTVSNDSGRDEGNITSPTGDALASASGTSCR